MVDLQKKSGEGETSQGLGNAIVSLVEGHLDLNKWNFRLSYRDFSKQSYQKVIYDSPCCRLSISFSRQRTPKYDELSISYGRLHAPNETALMTWQDQECRCWHSSLNHLYFLDGLSPKEIIEKDNAHNYLPDVVEKFGNSDIGKKLREEYLPKYNIVLEATIWGYYKQRLFDLFDLRHPELWDEYRQFLKEYYGLLGMKSGYGPPYKDVC